MLPFLKKKRRVLLLEDDPSMQRLVSALLKREGYRVELFLTGRDAIRALDKDSFDVLLLDLMMPHEGGMTVIRHLRAKAPQLLKRVLVVSGSSESVFGTIRDEVAAVVQKPFEASELVAAIKNVTQSQ